MRLVVLLVCLMACAEAAPATSRAMTPRTPSCEVHAHAIRCGAASSALDALGLVAPLRSATRRQGGGLWLLDAAGGLVRVDAQARATAILTSDFVALVDAGGLVCGLSVSGSVRCLADHPGDLRCGEAAPVRDAVQLPVSWRRLIASDHGRLCGFDAAGARECFALMRPCERACLQFPGCDAPLRCADPCAPNERSISFISQAASGDK